MGTNFYGRFRFTDRTSTAIRFPTELHTRLSQAADERDVPLNFLVNKAVEEFLDRLLPISEIRWTRDQPDPPPVVKVWATGEPAHGHQINKFALDDFLTMRDMTLAQAAIAAELDPSTLNRMVHGHTGCTAAQARALARVLDVHPHTLFPSTWTDES